MAGSSSPADPWHYPRPVLAKQYLDTFAIGLTSARGLFAKRRMGKSEFLEQDLIPAAVAEGYLPAYLNLWDSRSEPATALVGVLARAMAPKGWARLLQELNTPLKKVKASGKVAGVAEASLEAELPDAARAAGPLLSELLRGFDKPSKRLLLVLDEAQVLAAPQHAELAHALRAGLDSRKQNIKVVFAGSSEPTLRRMFGRSSEPFYNWAPLEPFELLGDDFVAAMVAKVNRLSKFRLAMADARKAFAALHNTPEFFRRYLSRYLSYADQGSDAALEETRTHVFNSADFSQLWARLLPADQEVLRMLSQDITDLHSESARLRLAKALGLEQPVPKATPQHALRRLQTENLVAKLEYGRYQLQDDAFAEWLRHRELDH